MWMQGTISIKKWQDTLCVLSHGETFSVSQLQKLGWKKAACQAENTILLSTFTVSARVFRNDQRRIFISRTRLSL